MRVVRHYLPIHLGLGEPAIRLAETAVLYPYGPIVAYGKAVKTPKGAVLQPRARIFDSLETFEAALRILQTNEAANDKLKDLNKETIDVAEAPCLGCRTLVALGAKHGCPYWSKVQVAQ